MKPKPDSGSASDGAPVRRDGMILIDNMLFDQEWFVALPMRKRLLYIYLLTKTSKVGVFELNLRRITYDMNPDDGQPITEDDVFNSFGGRIVKLGESKGIFVDYIAFNWMRDKPLDPFRNPLHRGLAQELARYGLSFEKVNAMSTKKNLKWIGQEQQTFDLGLEPDDSQDVESMFEEFWKEYPSSCPRKVDKKKCHDKFIRTLDETDSKSAMFKAIMDGLGKWKESYIWRKDGGNFIKAPLVWLNGACWNDNPNKNGGANGSGDSGRRNRPANYIGGTVSAEDTF